MMAEALIEPLSEYKLFQTGDLDEARAIVSGKFCDHRLNIARDPRVFDACHHRADGCGASLNYIRYGADVLIEPGELGSFYLVQIPLSGYAEIDNGGGNVESNRGLGSILNPHRETAMRWREGCAQLLLQVDANILNQEAERLLGHTLNGPVTFETAVDGRVSATADWLQKLKTCFRLAEKKVVFSQQVSATQMRVETELIADLLRSQPSNISAQLATAPSQLVNAHIRKAMRFVQNNLQRQMKIGDIAEASGTSPRNLQLIFRAEFGLSPMHYMRQQRLLLARRLIQSARPAETLGDIAFRAGFSHLGRFSAAYREAFGELPKDTVRRSPS